MLSFIYVGIYWNNHRHMLHACRHVTGAVMWANMHLLFWLSLLPFTTGWMGRDPLAHCPTCFITNLLLAAFAFTILQRAIIAANGDDHTLADAIGHDIKGKLSEVFYARRCRVDAGRTLGQFHLLSDPGADVGGARPAHRATVQPHSIRR